MNKQLEQVEEFNKTFKVGRKGLQPQLLTATEYHLRYHLMNEENDEYLEACDNKDLVEIADALGDQLYILCGTILRHGMHNVIEQVFNEIHRSNMSKLDENGEPIFRNDGKVLKGKNYFKPNIIDIIKR